MARKVCKKQSCFKLIAKKGIIFQGSVFSASDAVSGTGCRIRNILINHNNVQHRPTASSHCGIYFYCQYNRTDDPAFTLENLAVDGNNVHSILAVSGSTGILVNMGCETTIASASNNKIISFLTTESVDAAPAHGLRIQHQFSTHGV